MRILIDLQGAQTTGSRGRGIGRYSTSLAEAIVRNRGGHEVLILLNSAFPETIPELRNRFQQMLPANNILTFDTNASVADLVVENRTRRVCYEKLREAFIAKLRPDVVYITSLFEGLTDDAVISIGTYENSIPTAVTLYDLIPLINKEIYLKDPLVTRWYTNRIDQLRRADRLLSISESSRSEAIDVLNFNPSEVVNVGTAADAHFIKREVPEERHKDLLVKYGLRRQFVMYTGGIDYRKNIERLIQAFAVLPPSTRRNSNLAIVCSSSEADRAKLKSLANEHGLKASDLVLTGFVPEEDLIDLYNICRLFVFPSWHEGFGLPALEAMNCGAPVIGGNRSSLPEVIGLKEAMFDPFDTSNMASVINSGLSDRAFRNRLIENARSQAKKFSWDSSANVALKSLESLVSTARSHPQKIRPQHRPTLAFVSPLPPQRSGIATYNMSLLPELSAHYQIDCIVPNELEVDASVVASLEGFAKIRTVDYFYNNWRGYDRINYHIGNSEFHMHMFDLLRAAPGVVSQHDFFISGILSYMETKHDLKNAWSAELYRSHGYRSLMEREHQGGFMEALWRYPSNRMVFEHSLGVIVHNEWSRQLASKLYSDDVVENTAVVPLWRMLPTYNDSSSAREALGVDAATFIVCSFGILGETKLSDRILSSWNESSLAHDPNCLLVFVGQNPEGEFGQNMRAMLSGAQCANVKVTGWLDDSQYEAWLQACDVAVQLRTKSRGETSAAILDCMAFGKPTIVNAHGPAADLDSRAVISLPDEFEDGELARALENLRADRRLRLSIGAKALSTIRSKHSPRISAGLYKDAIERFYLTARHGATGLARHLAEREARQLYPEDSARLSQAICATFAVQDNAALYIDTTELSAPWPDAAQESIRRLIKERPGRVEPIIWSETHHRFHHAHHSTLSALGIPTDALPASTPVVFPRNVKCVVISVDKMPKAEINSRWDTQRATHQIDLEIVSADAFCQGLVTPSNQDT